MTIDLAGYWMPGCVVLDLYDPTAAIGNGCSVSVTVGRIQQKTPATTAGNPAASCPAAVGRAACGANVSDGPYVVGFQQASKADATTTIPQYRDNDNAESSYVGVRCRRRAGAREGVYVGRRAWRAL